MNGRNIKLGRIVSIGGKLEDWMKPKKKNKDERQRLYDQLEKLWPKAVKLTYGHFDGDYYYCEMCGKPYKASEETGVVKGINAHHVEGKASYNIRWEVTNGTPIDSGCHTMRKNSAHQDRSAFLKKLIDKRGQEWYDRLEKKASPEGGSKKWSMVEMKKKKEELQNLISMY